MGEERIFPSMAEFRKRWRYIHNFHGENMKLKNIEKKFKIQVQHGNYGLGFEDGFNFARGHSRKRCKK
jgi:hypothetical protein